VEKVEKCRKCRLYSARAINQSIPAAPDCACNRLVQRFVGAPGDKEPQRLPHQFPRLRGFVAPLQFAIHLRQMPTRPQQRQRPEIFAHSPLWFPRDAIQALDVHARVPEQLVFIHATQAARVIGQDGRLAPAGRGAPPKAIARWVWLALLPGQTRGDGLAEPALEELGLRPFGDRQIVIFSDVAALLLREMGQARRMGNDQRETRKDSTSSIEKDIQARLLSGMGAQAPITQRPSPGAPVGRCLPRVAGNNAPYPTGDDR
jgi:hypothetical protein